MLLKKVNKGIDIWGRIHIFNYMKTKLANYLNRQTDNLKGNQYLERFTGVPANFGIVGRQYGYRSSALRAIKRFRVKYFATFPSKTFQLIVNRIDEGCHEIVGVKDFGA